MIETLLGISKIALNFFGFKHLILSFNLNNFLNN